MSCFIVADSAVSRIARYVAALPVTNPHRFAILASIPRPEDHVLIFSDYYASCSCHQWDLISPRKLTRAEIETAHNAHAIRFAVDLAPSLARALYDLNVAAFNGRYEGRHQEDIDTFTYVPADGSLNDAAMLKTLECYRYQLAEDPVYGTPAYEAIKALESALETELARKYNVPKNKDGYYDFDRIPAYKAAPYGE